jgi:hypothetical protein
MPALPKCQIREAWRARSLALREEASARRLGPHAPPTCCRARAREPHEAREPPRTTPSTNCSAAGPRTPGGWSGGHVCTWVCVRAAAWCACACASVRAWAVLQGRWLQNPDLKSTNIITTKTDRYHSLITSSRGGSATSFARERLEKHQSNRGQRHTWGPRSHTTTHIKAPRIAHCYPSDTRIYKPGSGS